MANNGDSGSAGSRFEFRVWGKHRKARKLLSELATTETSEEVDDCYFLLGDAEWNAKVRDDTLKVKRLVKEKKGFEQWETQWHRNNDSTPEPFDELFDALRLDRVNEGKSFNLRKAVAKLDKVTAESAVFVKKFRTRYRIGELRAEATDIEVEETGEVLHSLAIEGDDLEELKTLRKTLGLRDSENVAVHVAIDPSSD